MDKKQIALQNYSDSNDSDQEDEMKEIQASLLKMTVSQKIRQANGDEEQKREDFNQNIDFNKEDQQIQIQEKQIGNTEGNVKINAVNFLKDNKQEDNQATPYGCDKDKIKSKEEIIEKYQQKYRQLLPDYFTKKSVLQEKYLEFWDQNEEEMKQLYGYFQQDKKNLTWEDFQGSFYVQIYEDYLKNMEQEIVKNLEESTINFIKSLNFDSNFDENWLMENIFQRKNLLSHTFLDFLILNKKQFTQILKIDTQNTQENILKQKAFILFKSTDQIRGFLMHFYQKIFCRYELNDQALLNFNQYEILVNKQILSNLQKNQGKTYKYIMDEINKKGNKLETKLNDQIYLLKIQKHVNQVQNQDNKKVQVSIKSIHQQEKELKKQYIQELEDTLTEEIGFKPSQLFLEHQNLQIIDKIEKLTLSRIQKIYEKFPEVKKQLDPQLVEIIQEFLVKKEQFILNQEVFAYIFKSLDKISGLIVRNGEEFNKYYQILYEQLDKQRNEIVQQQEIQNQLNISISEGFEKISNQIAISKKEYKNLQQQYEATKFERETVLRALVYLYFIYNNITIDHTRKLFCVGDISPLQRHFLYNIYQYMQFGEFEFIYFQVLQCLDIILEEKIIFNVGQKYQSATNNMLDQFGFNLKLDNTQYEILLMLREEAKNQDELIFEKEVKKQGSGSFFEQLLSGGNNQIQDENKKKQKKNQAKSVQTIKEHIKDIQVNQLKSKKDVPEKFYLRKLSDPHTVSRRVTICIAGYTSEKDNLDRKWSQFLSQNPDIEVYSLHYKSQSIDDQFQFIKDQQNLYYSALSFLSGGYMSLVKGGLTLATAYKKNPFIEAFKEATLVGKYLAHLIAKKVIFPNCTVSLVGFSLGTQVILKCLQELNKFQVQDVIQDVILMGGVADTRKLNKMENFNFLGGNLYNFYSYNDGILKFVFKAVKYQDKPAGLNEVKNICKVKNNNLTSIVKGHLEYTNNLQSILQKIDLYYDYN
ncbi:hypothetical protein PPERSA_06132 [Pseudocohnilembus persalinus]|uniref:Uncharacterized protein n=1 Tax=Pseudocohnilembus persalinus TaxID=266149 RepID=A0A0V0QW16_PSEPJ|nr:hypothetical protein PPERSA_06132 [Pseudocohnilembus persalinus]|eukprot:KRX06250.1 hypothetical protein PPERSA_06132 [Pseudocohnilembus persalinus]